MNLKRICLFLLLCASTSSAFPQGKIYRNEFGFRSDNDAYLAYGQDRYYTNGLFISFRHALNSAGFKSKLRKKIWEAEAGQKMYNAQSGYVPDISFVDRPFAAYLYAGAKLGWYFNNEQIIQGGLQAGVIGPAALGKEAQELLHSVVGFYEINGWQYQVKNELQLNTSAEYTGMLGRTASGKTDISMKAYANAGTTFSGAGGGLLLRLGKLNPLFNSVSTNSRITGSAADTASRSEFFFFAQPMVHLVAYDATVQGGLFRKDKGPVVYGAKPVVFSQELGAMYARNRWTFNFSVIFKTREIKSSAKPHQYGSASIYYRFN